MHSDGMTGKKKKSIVAIRQIACPRDKLETTYRFLHQCDQFRQVVTRKKACIQRIYFCLIASSGNLYKDLHTFYIYGQHKLAIKAFLCNTHCVCTAEIDM